jgi:NAD(P)H-hydrate epimerase
VDETIARVPNPPKLPPRAADGHKGSYGRVLVAAGSRGMTGAAVLCGGAALRGGAGLVRVACPAEVQAVVAAGNPCYTTAAIPQHADGTYSATSADEVVRLAEEADVVALGPGLGNRADVGTLVRTVLLATPAKPMILDADALNVLAPFAAEFPARTEPLILTPHPGEFARLLGATAADVQANREQVAIEFAERFGVVLVLKGYRTVVTDGHRTYTNETGNPGMATGGTGDVLTGLIAALVGQGLPAFDAAALAAWVHGRAGDLAAADLSQVALIASDLIKYLPEVFRELEHRG